MIFAAQKAAGDLATRPIRPGQTSVKTDTRQKVGAALHTRARPLLQRSPEDPRGADMAIFTRYPRMSSKVSAT